MIKHLALTPFYVTGFVGALVYDVLRGKIR